MIDVDVESLNFGEYGLCHFRFRDLALDTLVKGGQIGFSGTLVRSEERPFFADLLQFLPLLKDFIRSGGAHVLISSHYERSIVAASGFSELVGNADSTVGRAA